MTAVLPRISQTLALSDFPVVQNDEILGRGLVMPESVTHAVCYDCVQASHRVQIKFARMLC